MHVRVLRTVRVPATGEGGLPKGSVRALQTLTVGGGYDLPGDVAKDLIDRGLAQRVVIPRKVSENELRGAREARAALRKAEREKASLEQALEEARSEREAVEAALTAARDELEAARAELEARSAEKKAGEQPEPDDEDGEASEES